MAPAAGTFPPTAPAFRRKNPRWKQRASGPHRRKRTQAEGAAARALGPSAGAGGGCPAGKRRSPVTASTEAGQGGPRRGRREAPTIFPPPHPDRAGGGLPEKAAAGRTRQQSEGEVDPGPAPLSPYALGAGSGWKAKCAAERQGAAGSGGRRLQSPPRQRTDAAATAAAPGASAPRSARPAAAITAAVRGHRRCRRRVPKRRGPAQASLLASSRRRTDQSEAALPWVGGWGVMKSLLRVRGRHAVVA